MANEVSPNATVHTKRKQLRVATPTKRASLSAHIVELRTKRMMQVLKGHVGNDK
jgi:hypothetical protein